MKSAFAPAHVTGVFAIHDASPNPLSRGSRGAGWSLQKGAYASVDRAEKTEIRINGQPTEAAVTAAALALLTDVPLRVDIQLELPEGQGFGMSAAGTLAASLAACALLDIDSERALQVTHTAEVNHGTGLGDAIGSWFGGGEVRIKPGCPPTGWAMQVPAPEGTEFLFCVLGAGIPTRGIIQDHSWKEATRNYGDPAVDVIMELGRARAWSEVLHQSSAFSVALGLRPEIMISLGQQLPDDCHWGQCMLGHTMWITGPAGDLERAEALLEGHGNIYRSKVDSQGARLVRGVPRSPA
jgi:pantoate kinase